MVQLTKIYSKFFIITPFFCKPDHFSAMGKTVSNNEMIQLTKESEFILTLVCKPDHFSAMGKTVYNNEMI
jgi:hypothetical protein